MKTPLRMGSMEMKRMKNFKYLGDIIDEQGLEESVDATGEGKVKGSILELKAVCKDFQLQICGGMMGALDIFNMAICPDLLANCGSWINVGEITIKRLYSLQNKFVKVLLKLPSFCITSLKIRNRLDGDEMENFVRELEASYFHQEPGGQLPGKGGVQGTRSNGLARVVDTNQVNL